MRCSNYENATQILIVFSEKHFISFSRTFALHFGGETTDKLGVLGYRRLPIFQSFQTISHLCEFSRSRNSVEYWKLLRTKLKSFVSLRRKLTGESFSWNVRRIYSYKSQGRWKIFTLQLASRNSCVHRDCLMGWHGYECTRQFLCNEENW